jgi:anti-anti-sigma regulatory factor
MAAKGGRLVLCEIAPDIENVFVETKLNQIFEIMDMETDAIEACKAIDFASQSSSSADAQG